MNSQSADPTVTSNSSPDDDEEEEEEEEENDDDDTSKSNWKEGEKVKNEKEVKALDVVDIDDEVAKRNKQEHDNGGFQSSHSLVGGGGGARRLRERMESFSRSGQQEETTSNNSVQSASQRVVTSTEPTGVARSSSSPSSSRNANNSNRRRGSHSNSSSSIIQQPPPVPRTYRVRGYRNKRPRPSSQQQTADDAPAHLRQQYDQPPTTPGAYLVPGTGHGGMGASAASTDWENNPNWEITTTPSNRWKCQTKIWILLLVGIVIITVVVVVSVVVVLGDGDGDGDGDDASDNDSAINNVLYEEQLQQILRADLITNPQTLSLWEDPLSPQSRALRWLVNDTDVAILLSNGNEGAEEEDSAPIIARIKTRYVLAVFYFSTNGNNNVTTTTSWIDSYGFLSPGHECDWKSPTSIDDGLLSRGALRCDAFEQVIYMTIDGNHLQGTLPAELAALSHLETLNLRNNELSGHLPTTLTKLTALTLLDISDNKLSSTFPDQMNRLTKLEVLRIGDNDLSGDLTDQIGKISSLVELNVTRNQFAGAVLSLRPPASVDVQTKWQYLTNLQILDISDCLFTGQMVEQSSREGSLFSLINLKEFYFGKNNFIGQFPDDINPSLLFSVLSGPYNRLSGSFPWDFFQRQSNLRRVELSHNYLTSVLPTTVGSYSSSLEYMDFSNNKVSSSLPDSIGDLTALTSLLLSNNQLTGTLPSQLGNLLTLGTLDVSKNIIQGTLPPELSHCTNLEVLAFHGNQFDGTVPMDFVQLSSLRSASFHSNYFTAGDLDFLCSVGDRSPEISADCHSTLPNNVSCGSCCKCFD